MFDGRARRHVEILLDYADVTVINIASSNSTNKIIFQNNYKHNLKIISVGQNYKYTFLKHLTLLYYSFLFILKNRPAYIVSLNYFTLYVVLFKFFLFKKSKFIYDAYELLLISNFQKISIRDKFWFYFEKYLINKYDLVISANQERLDLLNQFYKNSLKNHIYIKNIPQIVSKKSFVNNTAIEIASKYNFSDTDKIIIYQGDVTIDRNLDLFLDTLYTLPIDFKFLIIGDGGAVPILSIKYNLFVNNRLFFTGRIINTDLPYYTRLGKIGIVSYPYTGLNNIFCSPNKVYEYAQSGLILLSTGQKTLQNMIDKYHIGLYILESNKTIEITNKIVSLFDSYEFFQNNLKRFINENLWESEILEYKDILNKTINS